MSDWPEDMRTINVKALAKIVRGLESRLETLKQGSPPASSSPSGSGATQAEGALSFSEWAPGALTGLITAEGYSIVGTASAADTVANLGAAWMVIMGIRGHSNEEIFAFWDHVMEIHARLDRWEAERKERNIKKTAEKKGIPVEELLPKPPPVFQGDRGAMNNTVTPEQLAAEDAVTETAV